MNSHKSTDSIRAYQVNNSKFSFRTLEVLLLVSLLASLAKIPYTSALLYQKTSVPPIHSILINILFSFVLITIPLTTVGLWLGPKVGLGTPELEAMLTKVPKSYRRLQFSILPATILGIVCGIFINVVSILSQPFLPSELIKTELPGFFPALLGSFGAAINEEIWLRLGIMTCLVWLGSKLTRQQKPGKTLVWSANLLAALGFASLHLPQAAILAKGLSLFILIFVLLLNGFVGVVFGWLYWRSGLLAAMIAHFGTGVIIHVVPTLFITGIK